MLAIPHAIVACFVLLYVTLKTHGLPDGGALAGLSAFATAPYAVNKVSTMFGKTANIPDPPAPGA